MPIVFVHGVNVRKDEKYQRETEQRDQFFGKILYPMLGRTLADNSVINPFWGDLASHPTPGLPFIPARPHLPHETLSEKLAAGNQSLLKLARERPLKEVFDLMIASTLDSHDESDAESTSRLGYLLLRFSKRFKTVDEQYDWLSGLNDDSEFLSHLETSVEDDLGADQKIRRAFKQSFTRVKDRYGEFKDRTRSLLHKAHEKIRHDITTARQRTRSRLKSIDRSTRYVATAMAATALTHPVRKMVHERLFSFIGDAFLYFGQRGTPAQPGAIVTRLSEAVRQAEALRTPEDPQVILIAHSMGGNIACDFLTYFEPETQIDMLITVGTQFPLFADLHMFPGLASGGPYEKPKNIGRWINVYDVNDVFGFAAEPLFHGVEDKPFASGKVGLTTHADCFKFISLYELLAQAILEEPN